MAAPDDYVRFLERLASQHQQRLSDALQTLEGRLAAYMQTAPETEGELFDMEWAVSSRNQIRQALEEEYLAEVQDILGDYREVAQQQLNMLNTFGQFTRVPPEVISALQRQSFQGFEALASQQLDVLANGVYQASLTGRGKADFIEQLRGSINGIYQASDQAEVQELVEVAKNATGARQQEAIDRLHRVYAADRLGNNLRRYASTYAVDSLNQFSSTLTITTANEQGIDRFEYYGDLILDSRDFCRKHVDKVYDRNEIEKIWEGEWAGKAPGDPFVVRGGYNCRHQWLPIVQG